MHPTPFIGIGYLLQGFRLIAQPGLRRFVAIPLLLNSVVFATLIGLGIAQFNALIDWLLAFLPDWLHWLEWLLWPVFALLALVFLLFSFTLFANLIGAPFNGLLAEAVERHLTGNTAHDQGWKKMLLDVLPSLWAELRKIGYFILWAIPFLLLFLIPGVNLFAPLLWLLFSAWVLALQYFDYPMANHGIGFAEQRKRLAAQRINTLSFGAATLVATLIPGINFLVMPAAVAGATAMWVAQTRRPQKNSANSYTFPMP